ncbi:MAG TPA: pyrroline-5-carboxylate reductase [Stellaceae bacterium]|nr:pyrroline-5-carboxylate reductase [Methylovirgula sp.]HLI20259.1 pyrroline-5-carboxylate reductase [Stellaceae bacterium]
MRIGGESASLLLVGAGKMGGALLQAWLDRGLDPARINVLEPEPSDELRAIAARGVALARPARPPATLVLAVKPQLLEAVAPILTPLTDGSTLVISILAGKTLASLARHFPGPIVRAMPNLPAAVGQGITAAVTNAKVSPGERRRADALLSAIGRVEWLSDESLVDAVTAVSGSGPAYVFYLAECLAKAGQSAGLPPDLAARLARATVEGAGALLTHRSEITPAELRQAVTSPGGTTAAALAVLDGKDGLEKLIADAVAAAKLRAQELSS